MNAAKKAATVERPSTLHDHIRELRTRLFFVAIVFIGASAFAYNYKDDLIHLLLKPLGDQKLYYLNPGGAFQFVFQITIYVGIAAAIPLLVYNLYRFVSPALPERAQRHSILVLVSAVLLLVSGVLFGYIYAIPGAINFLNNFGDGLVTPMLTGDSYLSFILAYTSGLGILFQLPLILLLIHWVHPLKPTKLLKFEKYMVLIAFVVSAIVTPTSDVINLCVIAAPIILMYQIGIAAVAMSTHNLKKRERKEARRMAKTLRKKVQVPAIKPPTPVPATPVRLNTTTLEALFLSDKVAVVRPAVVTSQTTQLAHKPVKKYVSMDGIKSRPMPLSRTYQPQVKAFMAPSRPVSVQVPRREYGLRPLGRMVSVDGISIIS